MFFKCSVEGFVQLRNISLSYTYIVIVKHGCLCKFCVFFFFGWVFGWVVGGCVGGGGGGGALRGGLARRVIQCRAATAVLSVNSFYCYLHLV